MREGILKGLELIKQVQALSKQSPNNPTHCFLLSNESPEDMIPQVLQLGGKGAFEPQWSVGLLEKIIDLSL